MENIADAGTYLRRKFRQDVTDKTTGVGVAALKKILAEVVGPRASFLVVWVLTTKRFCVSLWLKWF